MSATVTETELEAWLSSRVIAYGKVTEGSFTAETPFTELGLDSVYALTLCGDIEDAYGIEVDSFIVWDHQSIRELAVALAEMIRDAV